MKRSPVMPVPTASGAIARLAYQQAIRAGLDADALARKAGLTVQQLTDEKLRVAARDQVRLLNLASEALGDEFLGMRLAQQAELRSLGLLYYVLASSGTLSQAFARAARYSGITNESVRIEYRRGRSDHVSLHCVGISRVSDRHQIEAIVALMVRLCRQLTGRELVPDRIRFMHARAQLPPDLKSSSDARSSSAPEPTRCSCRARRETPRSSAPTPISTPCWNDIARKHSRGGGASRASGGSASKTRWRNCFRTAKATLPEVCRHLATTPRTLGRRLAAEDTTFADVLESLRHDLATRYLRDPQRSISEIAWLLGYRQTSSFDRAFRRWSGVNPGDARNKLAAAGRHPARRVR